MKNSYLSDKFGYRIGSTITVKSGILVGKQILLCLFSENTLDFLITDIFLEEGVIHFF